MSVRRTTNRVLRGFLVWVMAAGLGCAAVSVRSASPPDRVMSLDGAQSSWDALAAGSSHTLLVFMTLWCEPCKREQPDVEAWAKAHPDVRTLLVVSGSSSEDVRRTLGARKVQFPHRDILLDPNGQIADAFEVISTPTLLLLENMGEVVGSFGGVHEVPGTIAESKSDGTNVEIEDEGRELGTSYSVRVLTHSRESERAREDLRLVREHLRGLEEVFSDWRAESELNRVNQRAHLATVPVSKPLREVLRGALHISRATGGAFDVTWRTLAAVWEEAEANSRKPEPDEIARALEAMGPGALQLSAEGVHLPNPHTVLGLDGVAKGWLIDAVFLFLKERGYTDIAVNIGGDLRVGGAVLGDAGSLTIADPYAPTRAATVLQARDTAVATSGNYIRGRHILDPRTGHPPSFDGSVTVLAPDAAMADALATALFVLGPEEGMAFAESVDGVEAVYVTPEGIRSTLETTPQGEHSSVTP